MENDTYTLKSKQIPLNSSYDVIVVGGGPAGCTAAAAAAREGARTLLVEATGSLGGMGTSGLVPAWCPFSDKEKMVYRGLAAKVFNTLKAQMPHVREDAMDWVPIEPEKLKRVYDDLVTESGAHILFLTALADVERDDHGNITTLLLLNKGGLQAFRAAVYVDCTGDGDVAAWAGAECQMGDEETGELQPATHCFILGNVDDYAYLNGPKLHAENPHSPIHEVVRSGEYPAIPDTHLCNNMVAPRAVGFNAGHLWGVDNTNSFSVSGALVEGRRMAAAYRDMLAAVHPAAFGNAVVMSTGTLIGTRESRRITGDYVLTAEDYISRKSFDDEICRNSYFIDVHGTQKEQQSGAGSSQAITLYGPGESHGIPYRCLTPRGLRNVLVAGRSISCDRRVLGSVRVMPVCLAMGEAAGLAAALAAAQTGGDVHAVDVPRLRTRLREEGGYLPDNQAETAGERMQ
ncbi:tat (twin-arginine translocation) pathway signal sequence [Paenibacillus sp. FSL P4-0081]|uniref:FAD-dependent oxidoreductase n=1 Tax=Paenibacillus sp. FSL P4-0081 TaxID=1536769 RepID=UPI0004F8ADFE|nr:FAD-dependent oxidoreductase [Paenibacillus sp. FSL P4-0081]AIQ28904.1 tat (twin-arginine translocation) pathway signal sequence [Paenibacillus sp. FSL P4-0081]